MANTDLAESVRAFLKDLEEALPSCAHDGCKEIGMWYGTGKEYWLGCDEHHDEFGGGAETPYAASLRCLRNHLARLSGK